MAFRTMNRIFKTFSCLAVLLSLSLFGGCASLMEEDENTQQTPWAGPADWEGTVPGMPSPR